MTNWQDLNFVRASEESRASRQRHSRGVAHGDEVRVARGVYIDAQKWEQASAREQQLLRIHAVAGTSAPRLVISHSSAAVVHGLPLAEGLQARVQASVEHASGGYTRAGIEVHTGKLRADDIIEIDGLRVTSIDRTVIDLSARSGFASAVAAADAAIHVPRRLRRLAPRATLSSLRAQFDRQMPFRGYAKASRVIEFADSRSESPLESVSRANMKLIGCPKPRLQEPFVDRDGLIGRCDFYWPEFHLVGEADGDTKYLDPELRGGRTADQVVLDEKIREDRIRALTIGVTRWRWATGMSPLALRAHLRAAGMPLGLR